MPFLSSTKMGKGYRTTIPREARRLLGLRVNDEVEWVFENGRVYVRKMGGLGG